MPIILMVLGFIWWWPLGLVILGYLIARHRFGYWRGPIYAGNGPMSDWDCRSRWEDRFDRKMARMQEKMERVRDKMERYRNFGGGWFAPSSSGNVAFDDYRSETLKRLEEEQREFREFLGRLRFAKDRAEFDQFMAQRRQRPAEEAPKEEPPQS